MFNDALRLLLDELWLHFKTAIELFALLLLSRFHPTLSIELEGGGVGGEGGMMEEEEEEKVIVENEFKVCLGWVCHVSLCAIGWGGGKFRRY